MNTHKSLLSMLMLIIGVSLASYGVAEANNPASLTNYGSCSYSVTFYTNAGTQFGPALLAPGQAYNIKVPTNERIVRIVINGTSYRPYIPIGTCIPLSGLSTCAVQDYYCRAGNLEWIIR